MPFQKQNVCRFELIHFYFYFQWTQSRSTSRLTPSTGRRTRRTWPRTATISSPLSIRTSSTGIHPPSALGSSSWRCPLPSSESSSTSPSWSQLFIHIVPKRYIVFHIKMLYLFICKPVYLFGSIMKMFENRSLSRRKNRCQRAQSQLSWQISALRIW